MVKTLIAERYESCVIGTDVGVYPVMHAGNLFFGKIGFREIGSAEVSSKQLQDCRLCKAPSVMTFHPVTMKTESMSNL